MPRVSRAEQLAPRAAELRELHLYMRLAREWDVRFERLLRTGAIGKWYSSVGVEAITVPAAYALEAGDALLTLHRDSGAILRRYLDAGQLFPDLFAGADPASASGVSANEGPPAEPPEGDSRELLYRLACQMLGRKDGFTGGYDRSYHYHLCQRDRGLLHFGMISHLGAMIPVAAGVALALKQEGGDRVALNFIGEGGTSTGDFHEGLNMAAVLAAPLILIVENNGWAFSTPVAEQYACESLAARGAGYGIPGVEVDGSDPLAVREVVREAVRRARSGAGPTLIEARIDRLRGHSEGDDSSRLIESHRPGGREPLDPLDGLETRLVAEGISTSGELADVAARCGALILETVDRALDAADPELPDDPSGGLRVRRSVYAIETPHAEDLPPGTDRAAPGGEVAATGSSAGTAAAAAAAAGVVPSADSEKPVTYLEAIALALREEMARDPSTFLFGQDVAEYGGAFKLTRGFVEEFGKARVINTPIAESGAIGMAVGAALLDRRPIVEMQFGDFISCGFNQVVNVAAKTYWRTGMPVPLVIRCPVGAGMGAGPFHSQSPEAWFTHVPGLKVVAPATVRDAYGLLKASIRDPNPVLFLEHKYLYRRIRDVLPAAVSTAREGVIPLGRAHIVRAGTDRPDVTVITYGAPVHGALGAAARLEEEGIGVSVVDLRTLVPLDEEALLEAVRSAGKVLIVHEATLTGGFGAELAARIAEKAFEYLDGPIRRLAFPDHPVPFHKALEAAALPDEGKIARAARELASW